LFKRPILFILSAIEICILLASAVKSAHAYVDPGSGLLIFQVGGSMLAGVLFALRRKIRSMLGLRPKTETNISAGEKKSDTLRAETDA
jgi:hypothetical protein